MISAIALVDLDDTLFQTRRKCPPGVELTPYAVDAAGVPLSFATPAQVSLIHWLETTTICVAVTARSVDALRRSRLNYASAVAAHGGVILDDPDTVSVEWRASITATLSAAATDLERVRDGIAHDAATMDVAVRVRVLTEDGLPLYVVAKHQAAEGDDAALHAACAATTARLPAGWTSHINGNNVAYLPPGLGKAHAVAWLLPRLRAAHPGLPVIGIGDSLTDAPFLQLCDFAMLPTHSQLAARLFAA